MKKHTKNRIKWTGLTILLGLILWFAYDFHFKFVINDFQANQIEKQLQDNFHENQDKFDDLLIFSKQIKRLESVEFRENGQINFQVYDTSLNRTSLDNNFISIGDNSIFDVTDIEFLGNNSIEVFSGDQAFVYDNWIIDFEGEINNPLVNTLLSYNKINPAELKELKQKLYKIDCYGFGKNDSLITIRYTGHWGESFNYLIPITDKTHKADWNKLEDNYYWEHYRNGLFCGWTDW